MLLYRRTYNLLPFVIDLHLIWVKSNFLMSADSLLIRNRQMFNRTHPSIFVSGGSALRKSGYECSAITKISGNLVGNLANRWKQWHSKGARNPRGMSSIILFFFLIRCLLNFTGNTLFGNNAKYSLGHATEPAEND